MPKVNLGRDKRDEKFKYNLSVRLAQKQKTQIQMSKDLKTHPNTITDWRRDPSKVKVERLREMADAGYITKEDLIEMVFVR